MWKEKPGSVEVLTNYIDVLIASEKYDEAEKNLSIMKEKFSDDKNISLFEKKLQELNPKQVELEESDKDSSVITEEDTVLE